MNQPRYMQSKFNSTCCNCGGPIHAGEKIRYLGRSRAECHNCMPAENAPQNANAAVVNAPASSNWADALAWDDHEPIPGKSIGAHNSTPLTEITRASTQPAPVTEIAQPAPVAEIAQPAPVAEIAQPAPVAEIAQPAPVAETVQPTATQSAVEFTQSERAEGMTCELLVVLVNAISVAGVTGRHAVGDFAIEQGRTSSTAERASLWAAIARAVRAH